MSEAVRAYFQRAAVHFDAIYGAQGRWRRWLDKRFRRDMYERYRLTFAWCGDVRGKVVLDVGCGGGRYAVEFARRGAASVLGLDFAPEMIRLAVRLAQGQEVQDVCQFHIADFMGMPDSPQFDICIAIGVMDYVAQPRLFLEKMKGLARERMILSFPSKSPWRTPLRKVRYRLKRCPVYFYSQKGIENLLGGLGALRLCKIPGQGMDYVVMVTPGTPGDGCP